MTLYETSDMGFSVFLEKRNNIISIRDKLILSFKVKDEEASMISEVIFYDELLKLYKYYYGESLVTYTKITKNENYDMNENRYFRLKRLLNRKHEEVIQNISKEMSPKEKYVNEYIYERAMLGLEILYSGIHILSSYEKDLRSLLKCTKDKK
ncbi:MAG: hypothetical protein ACXQS3_01915 [Candidatus Methanofastidiosia archaeon]